MREIGHYWVLTTWIISPASWTIAYWNGGGWYLSGCSTRFPDEEVIEAGKKLTHI